MAKRLFDFLFSLLALIILSPLFILVALLIKLGSPGPVFYLGTRVGRRERLIRILKFRTMTVNDRGGHARITSAGDPRITAVGRVLRRFKVDELPQLLNVIEGDLSLVGPRPEDPQYVALYTAEQRQVLNVRPGITSPASLRHRNEESILTGNEWERVYREKVMPQKLAMDLEYIQRATFWSDIGVVLRTVGVILKG